MMEHWTRQERQRLKDLHVSPYLSSPERLAWLIKHFKDSGSVMEVAKVKEASQSRNNSIYFEVDPELGKSMNMSLKVLPMFRVKA